MPAVKKLKIDPIENGNNNSINSKVVPSDSDRYVHARTLCCFHLRPKKGLDR